MLWLDGEILENARIDASSAGLLLGHGVFTTVGVRCGVPLFLDLHLRRLQRDAKSCGLDFGFSLDELEWGTRRIIEVNQVEDGLARLTVSARGDGFWNRQTGTCVSILSQTRAPGKVWGLKSLLFWDIAPQLGGVKTTSYWPYTRAFHAAQLHKCDDALFLGHDKFLVESTRASLFWVRENALFTPSLESGCLRGVGRHIALDFARSNGLYRRDSETLAPLESLLQAEETFLVSSARGPLELLWLREPSGAEIALAGAGAIFQALRNQWQNAV